MNNPFAIDDIAATGADAVSLVWKGTAGRVYQVKRAKDVAGPYADYGAPIAADADGKCSIAITTADAAAAFFKIEVSVASEK